MLISVVIPYHNRESFLPRCLASVLGQTYRPIELILVDNNSTDASADVCREFAEAHSAPDFTVKLLHEGEPGACAARNAGAEACTAQYLSFFDSDDEMSPRFLSDMAEAIALRRADLYVARTLMVMPDGSEKVRRGYGLTSAADQILLGFINTQSFVVSKEFFGLVGRWNKTLMVWNDWELGVRMLLAKPRMEWLGGGPYHRIHRQPLSLTGVGFAHHADALIDSLSAVSGYLHSPSYGRSCSRSLWYLACRAAILSGHLRSEGKDKKSAEVFAMAKRDYRGRPLAFLLLKLLQTYTSAGGRGAWKLAKMIRFLACAGV